MTAVFEDDASTQAYVSLNLIITVIGSLASLFMIIVIHRMKVKTGHILLLLFMSYFQLIYDVFCFTANVDCGYSARVVSYFFHLSSGIAVSIFSNWIAFVALFIVFFRQKFDVLKNTYSILASAIIPGLASGIFYLIAALHTINDHDDLVTVSVSQVYNNLRLISVFLNFFFVAIIVYKIEIMSSKMTKKSPQEEAIRTLAYRMIYYPIVQAIGRSGYAWYELTYGPYMEYHNVSTEQYSSLIFLSIITPIVSIGYLVIFIIMQPSGYEHCKALLTCQPYDEITIKQSIESRKQTNSLKFSTDRDDEENSGGSNHHHRLSFTAAMEGAILKQSSSHATLAMLMMEEAAITANTNNTNANVVGDGDGDEEGLQRYTNDRESSMDDAFNSVFFQQQLHHQQQQYSVEIEPSREEDEAAEERLYYIIEHAAGTSNNNNNNNSNSSPTAVHHKGGIIGGGRGSGGILSDFTTAVVNILHVSKSSEN